MSLYRANDRLPEDETILTVRDRGDFQLFRERQKLKIRGIFYDMQLPDSVRQDAMDVARRGIIYTFYRSNESGLHNLAERLRKKEASEDLIDTLMFLIKCRGLARDVIAGFLQLILNNQHPSAFHTHEHTLTLSFNQPGTEFLNKAGESVIIPRGIAALLQGSVRHRAFQLSEQQLQQSPRVSCIL